MACCGSSEMPRKMNRSSGVAKWIQRGTGADINGQLFQSEEFVVDEDET